MAVWSDTDPKVVTTNTTATPAGWRHSTDALVMRARPDAWEGADNRHSRRAALAKKRKVARIRAKREAMKKWKREVRQESR